MGFSSSAGGSVMGADWLEEIELALQELILENERESKAEKTGDEDVEVDPNETILTKEEEKEVQRIIRGKVKIETMLASGLAWVPKAWGTPRLGQGLTIHVSSAVRPFCCPSGSQQAFERIENLIAKLIIADTVATAAVTDSAATAAIVTAAIVTAATAAVIAATAVATAAVTDSAATAAIVTAVTAATAAVIAAILMLLLLLLLIVLPLLPLSLLLLVESVVCKLT
ncbi:hypothetical protein QZH41_004340 [Actinostola sp. cb2023]|nr:hypothetical protein QZH41_004340 [Actinostola sp. cb2023]